MGKRSGTAGLSCRIYGLCDTGAEGPDHKQGGLWGLYMQTLQEGPGWGAGLEEGNSCSTASHSNPGLTWRWSMRKQKRGEITAPAELIGKRESFPSWRLIYTCKYVKSQLPLKSVHLGMGQLLSAPVIHRIDPNFSSQGECAGSYLGNWQHPELSRGMEIMDQADKNVGGGCVQKTAWEFRKISSLPPSCYGIINEGLILSIFASNLPLPRAMSYHQRTFGLGVVGLAVMDGCRGAALEPISPPPVGNESQHRWPKCRYRGTQGSLGLLVSPGPWDSHSGTGEMPCRHQPLFDTSWLFCGS